MKNIKVIFHIFLFTILSGIAVIVLNTYINKKFESRESIHTIFQSLLGDDFRENLQWQYRSFHFHIFSGLELRKTQLASRDFVCDVERIGVVFHYWNFTTSPKTITLEDIRCKNKTGTRLHYDILEKVARLIYETQADWKLHRLQYQDTILDLQDFTIHITPQKERTLRIEGYVSGNSSITAKIQGNWILQEKQNRIYFELQNHRHTFFLPVQEILLTQKENRQKQITTALSGTGSVDFSELGYAINSKGKFQNTKGELDFFLLDNLEGSYHYREVSDFGQNVRQQEWNLQLNGHNITLFHSYEKGNISLSLKGVLSIDNQKLKTKTNSRGNISINFTYRNSGGNIIYTPDISAEKFLLAIGKYYPSLYLNRLTIKPASTNTFQVGITGNVNTIPFSFQGNVAYNTEKKYTITGNLLFPDIDYQKLLDTVTDFIRNARNSVRNQEIVTLTDFTYTWKKKFSETETYRNYIKPFQAQIKIAFTDPVQPLPPLDGFFLFHESESRFQLSGAGHNSRIQILYLATFLTASPLHNLDISMELVEPQIEIPLFCRQCKHLIKKVKFTYRNAVTGISMTDFYLNNSSHFHLSVDSLLIENEEKKTLIENLLQTKINAPLNIKLEYFSSGANYNPIIYQFENEEIKLYGNGQHNIYIGGTIQFFYFQKKQNLNKNFILKIRKDGQWVPSHFF